MELDITKIALKGDRVLVKQLADSDKVGAFFVPDSVIDRKKKRRKDAWKAEVMSLGDEVSFRKSEYTFSVGDIVYITPVALDCPSFEGSDNNRYIVVRQEDLIAKEAK